MILVNKISFEKPKCPQHFWKKIVLCLTRGQASGVHVQNNVENSNNHIVYVTSPLESAGNLKLKYDLIQGYVQGCALEKGVIYGQPCQVQHFSLRKQMQTLACQMSKGTEPRFFPISWRTCHYTPILPPNKRVKHVFRWTPLGTRVTKYQPFGEWLMKHAK